MSHYCRDVQLFQNKFGFSVPSDFIFIPQDLFEFRVTFFHEEFNEYKDSVKNGDLATAIDSLVDLVYITCGTSIYHGIGFDKFDDLLSLPVMNLFPAKYPQTGVPHFLSHEDHQVICNLIESNINDYIDGYANKNEKMIKLALSALYQNCLACSTAMDVTNEQWDEFWDDVQRANMSKERATSASQSKRKSAFDIIKPVGWVPPRTEEILQKYLKKD